MGVVDDGAQSLTCAFPAALAGDVLAIEAAIDLGERPFDQYPARAWVDGEYVSIPYRVTVSGSLPQGASAVGPLRELMVDCLETRARDGHQREEACRRIVGSREAWVIPYVVRLLGEYVDEISLMISRELGRHDAFRSPEYTSFVRANEEFLALTEQRAMSYWGCNYRGVYPKEASPALQTLRRLRQGAISEA